MIHIISSNDIFLLRYSKLVEWPPVALHRCAFRVSQYIYIYTYMYIYMHTYIHINMLLVSAVIDLGVFCVCVRVYHISRVAARCFASICL